MKTAPTLRIDRLLVRGRPFPGRAFADRPFSDRGGGTGGDRPEDLLQVARLGADFQDRPGVRLQELVDVAEYRLPLVRDRDRSEEHTSELQSLMRISYAVFCLKKKKEKQKIE